MITDIEVGLSDTERAVRDSAHRFAKEVMRPAGAELDRNVKVEGNGYYETIHKELSKKYGVDKLTADQMGGLECGKCHY